jgi:hypothetical protein
MEQSLLVGMRLLFQGRQDVYAAGYVDRKRNGKISYATVAERLSDEVLAGHITGERIIGQYQLLEDSTVLWFALDFDRPKADGTGSPLDEALKQLAVFENAGLHVYLETSRSGEGYHVWGFLSEPVPAVTVRNALLPLLVEAENFDRLYPVQTQRTEAKPYGNLIALPFFGAEAQTGWSSAYGPGVPGNASVFLDPSSLEPIAPAQFLQAVRKNSPAVIEELADKAPVRQTRDRSAAARSYEVTKYGERNPEGRPQVPLRGAIKLVSDYGCRFMAHTFRNRRDLPEPLWYAAIQQMTCFEQGREAAHMLSRGYPGYTPEETDAKYDQALRHPPVGCQYIHENFPQYACDGCPMTAPYHKAKQSMGELVGDSDEMLGRSDYKDSLVRMRRRRAGDELPGVGWGIGDLDRYTRLRPSEMTVVGALPSIGKTALMVDLAVSLVERGVPVFLFSAETSRQGLEDRLLARVSGVDSRAIRGERERLGQPWPLSDEETVAVEQAARVLSELPLFTNYTAAKPERILNLVEEIVLSEGLDFGSPMVVLFDYLQFATPTDVTEHQNDYVIVSKASSEFKYLAKILRHPVVVFSQLKREASGEDEPDITWFKNSGRIEADADVAMIMTGERVPGDIALRTLHLVKQREGEAGVKMELKFHQKISMFEARRSLTGPSEGPDLFPAEDSTLD